MRIADTATGTVLETVLPHAYPWDAPPHAVGTVYTCPEPAHADVLCAWGYTRKVDAPVPRPKTSKKG